ncbi:capsular polysaccharide biosynthesis protein [Oceanisphaera arctica]|uniref:Beta-3-deoxy-D-manno-oct-2-ulosonic acid transferase n=1 Tax=Oceanisphaera arctica TaxID=641510 RepID=A0A2P5TR11_9GAMM|nr:capsular polysaccharide biosynthesis protein [Oceanisphaera arctica]PPL18254.1 beta-3-deoxy-D-manno-oct-2-ulosonic acid transferase [Oceanisphaera arctica]GHA12431.1 capsule polysaccharide modification protein LipA [Oceanisphaera arctica]
MLLTTSRGIWRQRRVLNAFLSPHYLGKQATPELAAVVGWGMKPNTQKARALAAKRALPFWQLEDGFVGYIGHPASGASRLSLIVDEVGVYYDTTRPSQLEQMLDDMSWWNAQWQQRAEQLQALLGHEGITKYNCYADNQLPPAVAERLDTSRPRVLVIDQTRGDPAVRLGQACERSFADMLAAAKADNPTAQIIVRTHPDVLLGKKQGYLTDVADDDVLLLADAVNPFALMAAVSKVYTVTSQLGFEALLAGKPVVCFGAPFYAGWGVTDDRVAIPRRGEPRTVPQLLAAAYLRYCRYVDPITGERCELEDLLDLILAQRSPVPIVDTLYAVGFSLWRRRFTPRFLSRYARDVKFVDRLPAGSNSFGHSQNMDSRLRGNDKEAVLVWGRRFESELANGALPVWRMEDGFLRSVGLGSDLRRPGSLVVDNLGMYYDPRTPSAIERYLAGHDFSALELQLGEQLVIHFREQALTKYNVGDNARPQWRQQAAGRPIILVPGQVDDDASIQLGSPFVKGNAALLQAVRRDHPEAFIVFKPHPDVVSGNRKGQVPDAVLECCADTVETRAGIVACLDECDTVHTLTSLTGLEALIRGKPVTVWGQPFYAGWGLTLDMHPVERRGRALPLAALVYATYAWYPTYVDYATGLYSTPLRMAWRLAREREQFKEPNNTLLRWAHRRLRKARYLWEALAPLGSFKR